MASVYRPTYTKPVPRDAEIVTRKGKSYARYRDREGKLRTEPLTVTDCTKMLLKQKKWRIEYKDARGVRPRIAGYPDRQATEQLPSELERRAAREQSGLVDKYVEHRKRPLSEHVTDWHQSLLDKGTTGKHADLVRGRALRVVEGCGFVFWPELSASRVQAFVAERRNGGLSVQTGNFYLQAIKQFCRWMTQDGRAPDSPLAHLKGGNVHLDRRHDRRAFDDVELRRLLETSRSGPTRFGMMGPDRATLYRLAVETGLRAGEIRSLTPRS
ncbi:MAG: hypothetical protein IID42_08400 [Planctomycetes bacterium]|nr:hypothetical protein [Planctomycetota bacterium]